MLVSVVICAHNPRADYLNRVLEALRSQTLPREQWELLLVDNASDVALEAVWDISWHPIGRHVHEPQLGLAIARRTGMQLAAADLIVFVDDDNVLEPNYLEKAASIGHQRPDLGVWGSGTVVPEFESLPDDYLQKLVPYLALRDSRAPKWGNVLPCFEATPMGVGMCVRRIVATAYRKHCETAVVQISDRRGKQGLTGHGDFEISYVACDIGFGIGVFPELRATHLIPRARVAKAYLLRLFEGTKLSEMLLAYKWKGVVPRSPLSFSGALSVVKHLVFSRGIDREMQLANTRATIQVRRILSGHLKTGHPWPLQNRPI